MLLAKIAADPSHSTTENLLNYINLFELTNRSMLLLRQAAARWLQQVVPLEGTGKFKIQQI